MKDMIKEAVDTARVAQRNYNLNKEIPLKELDTTISFRLQESPSKKQTEFGIAEEMISFISSLSTYSCISCIRYPSIKSRFDISIIFYC